MTPEDFARFLVWLDPEKAESGEAYERLRFRLVTFFSQRNSRFPEDLTDETINRVCLKFSAQKVENKMAFVYGFAKNVWLESLRREKDHQNIDEIDVPVREREPEDFSDECLEKCLNELSAESKSLILDYFSEERRAKIDLHKQLAEKLQTTQTALRMRIVRLKQALRVCLRECRGDL